MCWSSAVVGSLPAVLNLVYLSNCVSMDLTASRNMQHCMPSFGLPQCQELEVSQLVSCAADTAACCLGTKKPLVDYNPTELTDFPAATSLCCYSMHRQNKAAWKREVNAVHEEPAAFANKRCR